MVSMGHGSRLAEGRTGPDGNAGGPLAVSRCMRRLGIAYAMQRARAAQARAFKEIDPSAAIGRRSLMCSRKRILVVSSSDMA